MNAILDRKQLGTGYEFIKSPVWFSVNVTVPDGTVAAVQRLADGFAAVQVWLDRVYEEARAGNPSPEMPNEIKEILWPDAKPMSAKQQKKQASAAALSTESPDA